jgi:hypothetical protein
MTDQPRKSSAEILAELDRVRALLATRAPAPPKVEEDIPLLDEVVATGSETTAETVAIAAPPAAEAPPPSEAELETLIDKIIDREMPRIRLELKRALRDELRMRNLLK